MRKFFAAIASAVFVVIAPGFVAGLAPWWISRADAGQAPLGLQRAGLFLMGFGSAVLLDSVVRFVKGLGTPAPVFPTRRLVVSGLYRCVRNPMYIAVISVILGQSLVHASVRVLGYGLLIWLAFHLFVLLYEEPTLRATYGNEYEQFCANVPRWIPRLR